MELIISEYGHLLASEPVVVEVELLMEIVVVVVFDGLAAVFNELASMRSLLGLVMEGPAPPGQKTYLPLASLNIILPSFIIK